MIKKDYYEVLGVSRQAQEEEIKKVYRQLALRDILQGHKVSEIMTQDCLMVPPDITIEKLVNEHIMASGRRCFPVVADSRVLGLITMANIKAVPRSMWASKLVKDIMTMNIQTVTDTRLIFIKPKLNTNTIKRAGKLFFGGYRRYHSFTYSLGA